MKDFCIHGVLLKIPTEAGGVMLQSDDPLRWTYSTIHSALNTIAYMHLNTTVEHLVNGNVIRIFFSSWNTWYSLFLAYS